MRFLAAIVTLTLSCIGVVAAAPAAIVEQVRFASVDIDGNGAPQMLDALLFRPAAPGAGARAPAVVALHGCAGMYSSLASRRDALQIRLRTMGELLAREGYVVLFVDSFRSRGRESICAELASARTLTQAHRRLDALAALAYVQSLPAVAPDRVAMIGWSHGGSTVLSSLDQGSAAVRSYLDLARDAPFFRAAIAFYPGCYDALRAGAGYVPAAPLLMLVGGSDDWTSPQACLRLAQRLERGRVPVRIVTYPNTYHGFDGPDSQRPLHLDLPNGVHPGRGVTVAVNPEARKQAYAEVRAFLRDAFTANARP